MTPLARMRLWGMIRKESLQILRDPSSISIAFVMPVVLLFLFGYGVSLDAKHIPVGIVIEQPDTATQSLAGSFERSEFFRPLHFDAIQAAQQALDERKIDGIIWLRNNFSARLLSGHEAPIGVIINGVDSNQANITQGYIQGAWQAWLGLYAESRGQPLPMPVSLEQRVWFNAALVQPSVSGAGVDRHHYDPDWFTAHRHGGGARMGARHHGGADGDATTQGRDTGGQAGSLFCAGHGWHVIQCGPGSVAV